MPEPNDDIPLSQLSGADQRSDSNEQKEEPKVDSDGALHGARLIFTIVSLGLSVFLVALDGTIVSTAVPAITNEFKAVNDVGWVSSGSFGL